METIFCLWNENKNHQKLSLINSLCRLEEIGAAAAKEHSLEKALEKMKIEWKDMEFEMIPYRETVRWF